MFKVISVFVSAIMVCDCAAWAEPAGAAGANPSLASIKTGAPSCDIYIPEQYGTVAKQIQNPKIKIQSISQVILIKDAHCNYEAQKNIAKILEALVRDYGIDLVAVEGAEGGLDLGEYGRQKDEKAKGKAVDAYIKKGYATGPEYLSITKYNKLPFGIYGIENGELYVKNFIEFRNTWANSKEMERFINEVNKIVEQLKQKIYSKELLDFDREAAEYAEGKTGLAEWIKYSVESRRGSVEKKNIKLVLKSIKLEEGIDFKKVERERAGLIKECEKKLPKEEIEQLVKRSLEFRLGKISALEYYKNLESLTLRSPFPVLRLRMYIHLLKLQSNIDEDGLFREIDEITSDIKQKLFQNNTQYRLDNLSKRITILNKLFHLQLDREGLKYFEDNRGEFTAESLLSFIKIQAPLNGINIPPELCPSPALRASSPQRGEEMTNDFLHKVNEAMLPAAEFYKLAVKRDEALVENTLSKMREENKDKAVMVVGGFHTDGIIKLLERKGVNYTVITPKITKEQLDNPYLSVMLDEKLKVNNEAGNNMLAVFETLGQKGIGNLDLSGINEENRAGLLRLIEQFAKGEINREELKEKIGSIQLTPEEKEQLRQEVEKLTEGKAEVRGYIYEVLGLTAEEREKLPEAAVSSGEIAKPVPTLVLPSTHDRFGSLPAWLVGWVAALTEFHRAYQYLKDSQRNRSAVKPPSGAMKIPGTSEAGMADAEFGKLIGDSTRVELNDAGKTALKNIFGQAGIIYTEGVDNALTQIELYFADAGQLPTTMHACGRKTAEGRLQILVNKGYINPENIDYRKLAEVIDHEWAEHWTEGGTHRKAAERQKKYFGKDKRGELKLTPYHEWVIGRMTKGQLQAIAREYESLSPEERRARGWGNYENLFYAKTGQRLQKLSRDYRIPRMIVLSNRNDGESWDDIQSQWEIKRLIYSPGGIENAGLGVVRDVFGNSPYWIYELLNTQNNVVVYVGPDDIRALFPQRISQIVELRKEKEDVLEEYRSKLLWIFRIQGILGQERERIIDENNKIGDRHFQEIDRVYKTLEGQWGSRFPELSLVRFREIAEDIYNIIQFLNSRRRTLSLLSKEELNRSTRVFNCMDQYVSIPDEEINFMVGLHERLLQYQNQLVVESIGWAAGRARPVSIAHQVKTPAYHANLWIANWLVSMLKKNRRSPLIVDIGANLSNFWRVFRQVSDNGFVSGRDIAGGIVDLEGERNIYEPAPNPNRVLAGITDIDEKGLPRIQNSRGDVNGFFQNTNMFDIVIASFVLDQLDQEGLRNAVISIMNLLAHAPEEGFMGDNLGRFPLLVITMPEHAPIGGTAFERELEHLGFSVVIRQDNLTSSLSEEANKRILEEEGEERLRAIKEAISKPFHVSVYARVRNVSMEAVRSVSSRAFALRNGAPRRSVNGTGMAVAGGRLNPEALYNLDIISLMAPSDFRTRDEGIVTRAEIMKNSIYKDFEERLTACIYYRQFFGRRDRDVLNTIVDLWDAQDSSFLTKEQVEFVMNCPRDGLARYRVAEADIERLKKNTGDVSIKSILKQIRPPKAQRTIAIGMIVEELKGEGKVPTPAVVAKKLGVSHSTLDRWCVANGIDYESVGIVVNSASVDVGERIKQIKTIVANLKSQDKFPNLSNVAKELGLKPHSLLMWAQGCGVDLYNEDIDVIRRGHVKKTGRRTEPRVERSIREITIRDVKGAIKELKEQGYPLALSAVARRLGVARVSLKKWLEKKENGKNELGIGTNKSLDYNSSELRQKIVDTVADLGRQKRKPSIGAVAMALGMKEAVLGSRARRSGINLDELGIVRGRGAYVHLEDFRGRISRAVHEIIGEGGRPNIRTVSMKMGYSGHHVVVLARKKGICLQGLGVIVEKMGRPLGEKRTLKFIENAVRRLQSLGIKPTIVRIEGAITMGQGDLLRWAERYGIDLSSLSIETGGEDDNGGESADVAATGTPDGVPSGALKIPGTSEEVVSSDVFNEIVRDNSQTEIDRTKVKTVLNKAGITDSDYVGGIDYALRQVELYLTDAEKLPNTAHACGRKTAEGRLQILVNKGYINPENIDYRKLAEVIDHEWAEHWTEGGTHRKAAERQKKYFGKDKRGELKLTPYHEWVIGRMDREQLDAIAREYNADKEKRGWGEYEKLFYKKAKERLTAIAGAPHKEVILDYEQISKILQIDTGKIKELLSDLDNKGINQELSMRVLNLMKVDGRIDPEEARVVVDSIDVALEAIDAIAGYLTDTEKKEAVKRLGTYLAVLKLQKQAQVQDAWGQLPGFMNQLKDKILEKAAMEEEDIKALLLELIHMNVEFVYDETGNFNAPSGLEIYLNNLIRICGEEIRPLCIELIRYKQIQTKVVKALKVDLKDIAEAAPARNIAEVMNSYLRDKKNKNLAANIIVRYLMDPQSFGAGDAERIKRIINRSMDFKKAADGVQGSVRKSLYGELGNEIGAMLLNNEKCVLHKTGGGKVCLVPVSEEDGTLKDRVIQLLDVETIDSRKALEGSAKQQALELLDNLGVSYKLFGRVNRFCEMAEGKITQIVQPNKVSTPELLLTAQKAIKDKAAGMRGSGGEISQDTGVIIDASLYLTLDEEQDVKGGYVIHNTGEGGIEFIRKLALSGIEHRFICQNERHAEAMKMYLAQHGIEYGDGQFRYDIINQSAYAEVKRKFSGQKRIVTLANPDNPENGRFYAGIQGRERIVMHGDLALAARVGVLLGTIDDISGENQTMVEGLKAILKKYYEGTEYADGEKIKMFIGAMLKNPDSAWCFLLPPITPILNEYYTALKGARELILSAA